MRLMKKHVVFSLSLAIITVLSVAALGEIWARLTSHGSYLTDLMRIDRVFHHLPPPYYKGVMQSEGDFDVTYSLNNRGMRGRRDYRYEKDASIYRIAIMGDSIVFGVGVELEDTMPFLLEDELNNRSAKKYEILNFGINSYSPVLEYIYLTKEVVRYRPDFVILLLDECDIQDDYLYEPHIVHDDKGEIEGCDPLRVNNRPDLLTTLMWKSRLLSAMNTKLFDSFRKMKAIGFWNYLVNKYKGKRNKDEILSNYKIDNIYFDRFLFVRDGKDRDVVMRHWRRTARYLLMIKQFCDERGIKFMLVTYPYGHQVGANQWPIGRRYWAFESNKVYDCRKPLSIVEEFAKSDNIDYLNLCDAFRKNDAEQLFFARDGHWTKVGHEVASDAILNSISATAH